MPQNNEIVAALPASGPADKELLRAWAVQRNSFNLRPDEDLQDFVMIDPDGGGTTPSVTQNGMLYGHDPDDVITAHDGVICLVSYDAQRYKLEAGLHAPFNVLDKDLTAPPVSPPPSYGDAYLIYGSPTGAWAGKSGYIAIFTARGWSFCLPALGFLVYVRDESSYYHRDSLGAWVLGTGTRTLGNNSVTVANIIGKVVRFNVVNQTTTAPPASPTVGDQYIIGPSATGGWSGLDGRIAICEDGATFTVYSPSNGWVAYDKFFNAEFRYTGSAWASNSGVWVSFASAFTASGSTTAPGSIRSLYSATIPPATSVFRLQDDVAISHAARAAGSRNLRFVWQGDLTWAQAAVSTSGCDSIIALYRGDAGGTLETNAVAWQKFVKSITTSAPPDRAIVEFVIDAADTNVHTYKIGITQYAFDASTIIYANAATRRTFTVEERV